MAKIGSMMDLGKRSMMNSQEALQTVGHNIASKNVEGFSRQRVEQVTNIPTGVGNIRIGNGARAAQVTRINNPYLEKQIQKEGAELGFMQGRADALSRVEQIYNEQINKGLNQYMTQFFNSFRELSNNPESLATRTLVKESADYMARDFKRVDQQLTSVQEDLDMQIKTQLEEVNQFSKEIASLNEKIQGAEIGGAKANDERDRRDLLLKKMGEKIDMHWGENNDGQIAIMAGNVVLVSGYSATMLEGIDTPDRNRMEIFYRANPDSVPTQITDQMKGGSIGAALEVRDKTINELREQVDKMAFSLATEVNKAHVEGYDRSGRKGVLFFDLLNDSSGAASNIKMNETVLKDVSRIVTSVKPNAPSDNSVSNVISSLQYREVMDNGTATLDEYYNSIVGKIGVMTQRAVSGHEAQKNIVGQLQNIRESISGVSLDEETTKMIEFQKAYDASARLIRTADEMFDTVLNLKRM